MGKHSKPKSKHSNRKKILTTSVIAIGLLTTQTTAYAAVEKPKTESVQMDTGKTEAIQRVVAESGIVETGQLNTPAIVAPVTASKDATVSFEKPVITSTPNPERIAEENRIKVAEAAKVEAEKQAVIDAEAAKVAAEKQAAIDAEAAKVAQATKAQQTTQYGYSQAQSSAGTPANSGAGKDSSTPASGRQAAILAAARAQIGVNQDCTMLVTNSLKAVGINFHDWPAGYLKLGPVTNNPQPGDLIYYASGSPGGPAHVAIYSGNGKAVHGGWNGVTTVEFSVNVGSGPVYISMA